MFGAKEIFGPEGDHMALLVNLEQRWLVDVGFGDSFHEPLLLDERGEQLEEWHGYRIEEVAESRLKLSRREKGWHLEARSTASAWSRTSTPTSPRCAATPDGRITLSGRRLLNTQEGEKQERELVNENEVAEVLRERFGIVRGAAPDAKRVAPGEMDLSEMRGDA